MRFANLTLVMAFICSGLLSAQTEGVVSLPSLAGNPCAVGNVGINSGGPYDVVTINGSSGGVDRRVSVAIGAPFSVEVAQPVSNPALAAFVLTAYVGIPTPSQAFTLPFELGTMCFSSPHLVPFQPNVFVVTNNWFFDPQQLVVSTPAPWAFNNMTGFAYPINVVMQGIIYGEPGKPQLTNAIILNVL